MSVVRPASMQPLPDILTRFNPAVSKAVALLSALLLFTFKVNLVSVGNESAGLRLDDGLIFLMGAILAVGWLTRWKSQLSSVEAAVLLCVAVFTLSNLVNIILFQESSLLYSLRLIEYFLFFYFGAYYGTFFRLTPLVSAWFLINVVLMIGQFLGVIGGFASEGYASIESRAMGVTGGPWEVGAIINFCFAIFLSEVKPSRPLRALLLFVVTFSALLLTGARMPALANVVLLLLFFKRTSKNFLSASLKIAVPVIGLGILLVVFPSPVSERSAKLLSFKNVDLITDVYQSLPVPDRFRDFPPLPESVADNDFSWAIRAMKWAYVTKLWTSNPRFWLLGLGPGTVGIALDGGWLRVLVETGVIGLTCFILVLRSLGKISLAVRDIVIALSISMIMIDIQNAYKAMSFVFFAAGYYYQQKRQSQQGHARSLLESGV